MGLGVCNYWIHKEITAMPSYRQQRLDKDLRAELAREIQKMKDPRIDSFVSVMRVEVTSDLSYATVRIGSVRGYDAAKEACAVLTKAAGHLRSALSRSLHIRKAPELRFLPDDSAEYADHINRRIEELMK